MPKTVTPGADAASIEGLLLCRHCYGIFQYCLSEMRVGDTGPKTSCPNCRNVLWWVDHYTTSDEAIKAMKLLKVQI